MVKKFSSTSAVECCNPPKGFVDEKQLNPAFHRHVESYWILIFIQGTYLKSMLFICGKKIKQIKSHKYCSCNRKQPCLSLFFPLLKNLATHTHTHTQIPLFVCLSPLTSPSSNTVFSTPLCASRYFEWNSRPSKLCQGIRAALGSGQPLAQLAPSRWLSPRT